jgi:F-type H+-transporting ATPase subunit b
VRKLFVLLVLMLLNAVAFGQHEPAHPPSTDTSHTQPADAAEAHNGDAHGGAHEEKSYFGIPGGVLKLLNMLLFFGLLGWFVGRPIKAGLSARREKIRQDLQEARDRREKADRMAADIQGRITRLEDEVALILTRAGEEGERQKEELIAAANAEAEKILRSARAEVDARLKLARKELTDYAGELAAERARSLLEETLTDSDRRKIFDESLQDIAEERS